MKFQKKTDQELAAMNLIEAGVYPFEVIEAKDSHSKSGNEMITLKLKIWDDQGRERVVFDYLLEQMAFKLKHFCDETGLAHKYDAETLMAIDCLGKSGYLELIIQKDKSGLYGDKNAVKDYVSKEKVTSKPQKQEETPFHDDDIPF